MHVFKVRIKKCQSVSYSFEDKMVSCCFKNDCKLEAEYLCLCLASETYTCEYHLREHLKLPNRTHVFDSVLEEPREWAKDAILEFLIREQSKKEKLSEIVQATFRQNAQNLEIRIEESLKNLTTDLKQISDLIEKISQVSEQEVSQKSNLLNLESNTDFERLKALTSQNIEPYSNVKLFCILRQLRKKKSEILNRIDSDPKLEEDFNSVCSSYEKYSFDPLIKQTLQDLKHDYQRMTSLYLIDDFSANTNLFIYDTVGEKEEIKVLETPEQFKSSECMIRLPNGELFIIGEVNSTVLCFIIDRNYKFQELPSGWSLIYSSAVYFNRSIYCFGGLRFGGICFSEISNSSGRFDLDENRWIHLAPMPNEDLSLSSIIFNGNIVISGFANNYIYLYSIDIDSYSEIPLDITPNIRKLLIKVEERLYLIESNNYGLIYESEIGDEYSWKLITYSMADPSIYQMYGLYHKGEIYIATIDTKSVRQYFKFDLSKNDFIDLAYYSEHFTLSRLGGKFEAIKHPGETLKLDHSYAEVYNKKKYTLCYLGHHFEFIENCSKKITASPDYSHNYLEKGSALCALEWNLEAIECFNKAIELSTESEAAYISKGYVLHDLGRNEEAIECYNQVIRLNCKDISALLDKGAALCDLGRNIEAIECYNEVIKSEPHNMFAYIEKGDALRYLGRYTEAIDCYDTANSFYFSNAKALLRKGHVLVDLGRYFEAMECYNKSIELNPADFLYFCYRANLYNDMGQELEAQQDFNEAYNLVKTQRRNNEFAPVEIRHNFFDEALILEIPELLKMLSKLQENAIEFKKEIQKLRDASQSYPEMHKEVEDKEIIVNEQHSKLLKRAIESINLMKSKSVEAIQQIENEVIEHQKNKIDIVTQLRLLLSLQQQ